MEKKRTSWELKAMVSEVAYTSFTIWCVERGLNVSDVIRVVTLAARHQDKRLSGLLKDYDAEEARP